MFACSVFKFVRSPVIMMTIVSVLFPFSAFSGNDTLKHYLDQFPTNRGKLEALKKIIEKEVYTSPNDAVKKADVLWELADSLDYPEFKVDAYYNKSRSLYVTGQIEEGFVAINKAIILSEDLKDTVRMAQCIYIRAVLLNRTEGSRRAIPAFKKSLMLSRSKLDSLGIANSLNALGAIMFEISSYDSASYYLVEAERIADKRGYEDVLGKVYINLGLIYDKHGEYKAAKTAFKKAIAINEKLGVMVNVINATNNLGNIYSLEEKLDSAYQCYTKVLELSLDIGFELLIAHAYNGLGDVAYQRKQYDKSYDYHIKAGQYYAKIDSYEGILISVKNRGMIHQQWGNYTKARQYFDSALVIAREQGLLLREVEILDRLCYNYEKQGDYFNAYQAHKRLKEVSDTIYQVEKREKIADLELKYEQEKKNAQILALTNQNLKNEVELGKKTRQRNTYLYAGTGIIALFVFFFSYYSQRTRKNRIINEQKIKQLEEEKKLLAARFLVEGQEEERKRIAKELHDGLGVLLSSAKMHFTTIQVKMPENKVLIDKATKLLEQATGDVRRISHNMMPGLLTKFGLFEAVEELLEQVDEMEGIRATVHIEGKQRRLKENTEIMLFRIVQEMVNNTLKHAEANRINLVFKIASSSLEVDYSDDGKGFDPRIKLTSKSIGLTSIQSRIKFLGGELKFYSEPGKGVQYSFKVVL